MMRRAGEVGDDAMISPGEIDGWAWVKYATIGIRGVSCDEKRCERSFVGKHE